MKLLIVSVLAGITAIVGVVFAARDIVHRQNHAAHVATVAVKVAKVAKAAATKQAKTVKRQTQAEINRKIIASQLNACRRGNRKNVKVNYVIDLLRSFMLEAVKATQEKPGSAAMKRAVLYQSYADHLSEIPNVNCAKVIYRP